MSLTPPYSAVLLISLTRISAIVSNDGNNSEMGELLRGLMELMPSMLIDSMLGFEPATDKLPLLSISTPGCVVSVVNALVDPAARDVIATGKSFNSRPNFDSAMLDPSVLIGASLATLTFTVLACVETTNAPFTRMVCRASSSRLL